jgi:hypothetical protein
MKIRRIACNLDLKLVTIWAMKKQLLTSTLSVLIALLLATPVSVLADQLPEQLPVPMPALPPVIITEVQIGMRDYQNGSASDEFIELHNTTGSVIDITGWEVRYYTALSTTEPHPTLQTTDASRRIKIGAASTGSVLLVPHGYFVLYAGTVPQTMPATVLSQSDALGLATTDRSLVLLSRSQATCEFKTEDAVAWGVGAFGEGAPVPRGAKDIVMQRYTDTEGVYVDTNDNSNDFAMTQITATYYNATPGQQSSHYMTNDQLATLQSQERTAITLPIEDCVVSVGDTNTPPAEENSDSPPSTTIPAESDQEEPEGDADVPTIPLGNRGLRAPQLSELLPNPGTPLADDADEFIELYNPNDAAFDLSGYVLETGITTKRRFTFTSGTMLPPKSFTAFFSSGTNIALSNTTGQVRLIDPLGVVLVESDPYGLAKDNQSWLLANGTWQWTAHPTPGSMNILIAPASKKTTKTTTATMPSSASKKTTAVKTASTAKTKETPASDDKPAVSNAASTASRMPLHPLVLALVGGFALLYGAYEYRKDLANKFYQLRSNRAARRAARAGIKGR